VPTDTERRLAAVLSADVAGYSRLMAEDDDATVDTLTAYREEIARIVERHAGRVVDNPGDNVLCEFAAATRAVACGLEIQRALAERNAELAPGRRMVFRIGIHLGEVLAQGPRIYGDGVNVAARLQALAEPGSVYVSHAVREQLGAKQSVAFDDLGEHAVKNIPTPVRVFQARAVEPGAEMRATRPQRAWPARIAAALAAVALAGAAAWLVLGDRQGGPGPSRNAGPSATAAAQPNAAAELPVKSVAVLPFDALSTGPDDRYFADGLTEEVINALATVPDLLVTARTSAFYFKQKSIPISAIAEALGVAHVVEGSVRRSGDRVRVTAQLIRASDGFQLWSEVYERPLGDVFAVQSEIAASVAGALGVLLDERRRAAMSEAGVGDVAAFIAYQRGVELFDRAHNDGPLLPLLARANLELGEAIARKPDFAYAHFQRADYFAHFLLDEAPRRAPGFVSDTGLTAAEAQRQLLADLDAAYRYERDPGQRLVVQVIRTTVSQDWRSLGELIPRAFARWHNCRHGLWIDQTAITFGHGEAALAHDLLRARCDPLGGNWNRAPITAVWIGRPREGLAHADRIEALRGQDRDVMHARLLAHLALGRFEEAEQLFAAGNFGAKEVSPTMAVAALQIPAAAGRAEAWQPLRSGLARDPVRRLVGAAVFGDREAANRAAAEIDAMTLGPTILLRATDRCGCGAPFDLAATPNFARLLREGSLPWSPPAPIAFPLKTW
jgi:TolB-like protein/class 3 adenylate cyclase